MKQYKAYAFDLDLTLLNTLETSLQAYKAAFKAFNQDFDKKDVVRHLAIPLIDSFKEVNNQDKPYEVFLNAFVDTARRTFLEGSFFYEDALVYLKKLYDDGYKLGIVTNRDLLVVEAALNKAGIRHYFSSIITNEKVSKLKPNPEPINKCLEELGVTKEEMVYFGDAKNDWMSACNAGVDFITVERYDNCKYDAKERINSFEELLGE